MNEEGKLGQILIDAGYLNEVQFQECISEQARDGATLVKVLLRNQYVTEDQVVEALSSQLGIPVFEFDDYSLSPDLGIFLSDELVRQHQIIPIEDGIFSFLCAVVDPLDSHKIERVEREIGKPVDLVICTQAQFDTISEIIYGDALDERLLNILDDVGEASVSDEEFSEHLSEQNLEFVAAETPVVKTVNWMLAKGVQESASDIHLSPERKNNSLRKRIDGR
jgi:type IV pilus assembly protein PilB